MVLLLDGFDEYGSKEGNFSRDVLQLHNRSNVKIVITSRIYYQDKQQIEKSFDFVDSKGKKQTTSVYYICPFDRQQREQYIANVITNAQHLKSHHIQFDFFPSKEKYLALLDQNRDLDELAKTPFNLRLAISILPELHKAKVYYKYKVYDVFKAQWYHYELKRFYSQY